MTENLLYKLEEKVMSLLSELEALRQELYEVKQENATLKSDKTDNTKKLEDLILLLDETNLTHPATISKMEEYA